MKKYWVWDLETLANIFTATFLDRDSDEKRVFVISKTKNEKQELFNFLNNEVEGLIGYNSLYFDAQVIEYMYRFPDCTHEDIAKYAQIITGDNDRRVDVPEWKLRHKHLDLYKVNHFDNKNRRTGLKWCEFGMDLENIEDMPSQGDGSNWEELVLSYNFNDVIATKELYKRTKPMIELRKELTKLYGINFINYSNTKIGSELLLNLYCKKSGKYKSDVKTLRTKRNSIVIKNVIFDYIKFESLELKQVLKYFQNLVITSTKKETNEKEVSFSYKGFDFVYGKGGIHGSISNKEINSDEYYIIIDADVGSLYPSIAVVNRLYPQHLGEEFCDIYKKEIVDVRLAEKAKKEKGNKAIVEGFKEAANATYGNSNQEHSWLYDPKYTMATTINGQLMLTMLAEKLMNIPESNLLQINTDGLTLRLPKKHEDLYYSICKEWEQLTKLNLEYAYYKKMVISDVNNYLSVYSNGKTKCKGKYEFENIPLHKNKSHSIIPKAVFNYWVNNVPVEETIKNSTNIFDFCAGVKAKKSDKKGYSHYELHGVKNGNIIKQKLSKTVRYYISNKGSTLIKVYETGDWEHVEAPVRKGNKIIKDWKVTYFNKAFKVNNFSEYNIDYTYYISQANKWIDDIKDIKQLQLF